jgi:rSAM/selenodomain-associated transferase 1
MTADRCLCVFARTPALGQVKRRLAEALGEAAALAAHEELLEGTLRRCLQGGSYRLELWLTDLSQLPDWLCSPPFSTEMTMRLQGEGDLGARMWETLRQGLNASSYCVLIGSDCPDIDAAYVAAAFEALAGADVVLGPAADGGYGLIGLSKPLPELFLDMRWGDSGVRARTLARAARSGASVVCLPEIYDVDRLEDWQRYRATNPVRPPETETE